MAKTPFKKKRKLKEPTRKGAGRTATFNRKEIAEFARTHTVPETEREFGCSRSTVTQSCEAYAVEPVSGSFRKRQTIAHWVRDNDATPCEAAKHFKTSRMRIMTACTENDVTPKDDEKPTPMARPVSITNFEILRFLWDGYSLRAISEETGVSYQRIGQVKQRAEQTGMFGPDSILQLKA